MATAGQPGRTSETGRHPRSGASRLTRRAVPTGPFDTNLLELAWCGLLAVGAAVRGRASVRTAAETREAEATSLRGIEAPHAARYRGPDSGRRSTGLWAARECLPGSSPAPASSERRYRADTHASPNRDGTPAGRRTRRARDPIRAQVRFGVLQRDGFRCRYCGRPGSAPGVVLHVDHVVSLAAGGASTEDNLLTACEECNLGKSTRAVVPVDP